MIDAYAFLILIQFLELMHNYETICLYLQV